MKKPSPRTISLRLKELRNQCENHPDAAVARISQAMEHAIRWATEETSGWPPPQKEAQELAEILNHEIRDQIAKEIRKQ